MLKGQKKHIDKEQGMTKHETPRNVNYRGTQNKNNIGTTALERSVVFAYLNGSYLDTLTWMKPSALVDGNALVYIASRYQTDI